MSDLGQGYSNFGRLCAYNSALSRKLKKPTTTDGERALILAEMERNREEMRRFGKKASPCLVRRKRESADEAEEADRQARRRAEGYW